MKRVKDKRITLKEGFLAVVEYYRDRPERDGDLPREKHFITLKAAQEWLLNFPADIWDGTAINQRDYKEIDEERKCVPRKLKRGNRRSNLRASSYDGRGLISTMLRGRDVDV
jgi:hypothetical protein